ncbi:MAG: hypothetical protein KDA65_04600 [Planctomycetaceae bacterium]|nr:hypothetical protein [Planctomycetaceae bacterium]
MNDSEFKTLAWADMKVVWIASDRIEETISFYEREQLDGFILSPLFGYKREDLDFLSSTPDVRCLVLLDSKKRDIDSICQLNKLEYLSLDGNKQPIDFSKFPVLRGLWTDWHAKLTTDNLPQSLEILRLDGFNPKSKSLNELRELKKLEDLTFVKSTIEDLDGIQKYPNLHRLVLAYMRNLSDISTLGEGKNKKLTYLELGNCKKLSDYSPIGNINSLVECVIDKCGPIPSLTFMKDLPKLTDFRFLDTKVLDGDMTPLMKSASLRGTAFTNSPEYSHKEKEVKSFLDGRK